MCPQGDNMLDAEIKAQLIKMTQAVNQLCRRMNYPPID